MNDALRFWCAGYTFMNNNIKRMCVCLKAEYFTQFRGCQTFTSVLYNTISATSPVLTEEGDTIQFSNTDPIKTFARTCALLTTRYRINYARAGVKEANVRLDSNIFWHVPKTVNGITIQVEWLCRRQSTA